MKQRKPEFKHYPEIGVSICKLKTEYGEFIGKAKCHPDDEDMKSEKVGCEIAYCRATIKSMVYARDGIIKPSIKALKQLLFSMKHSKKFNPKSYEIKMLWRQIRNWTDDLNTINNLLAKERTELNKYIKSKEELYQRLREKRNNGQN